MSLCFVLVAVVGHCKNLENPTMEYDNDAKGMWDAFWKYIIITCLVRDAYKPSFATVTGRGPDPKCQSKNA